MEHETANGTEFLWAGGDIFIQNQTIFFFTLFPIIMIEFVTELIEINAL